MDSFLDPTGVPVWASINRLNLLPKAVVTGLIGVLRNVGGLGTGESYIPVLPQPTMVIYMKTRNQSTSSPDKTNSKQSKRRDLQLKILPYVMLCYA